MIVLSALLGTPQNRKIRDHLARHRRQSHAEIKARIERGIKEGDVPAGADADQLAAFYSTILEGLSIRARDGASRKAIQRHCRQRHDLLGRTHRIALVLGNRLVTLARGFADKDRLERANT
jgi:hypothetical protein